MVEQTFGSQRETPQYATLSSSSIHSSAGSSISGGVKLGVTFTWHILSALIEYCCLRKSIKAFLAIYFALPSTFGTTFFQNSIASIVCFIPSKFSISHCVILLFGCNNWFLF